MNIEEEFKPLSESQKRIFVINFVKEFFSREKRPPSFVDIENFGCSTRSIRRLFGNLGKLYQQCDIPYFRRERGVSDDPVKMKAYLENIKIVDPIAGCWTTDKLLPGPDGRIRITYKGRHAAIYHVAFWLWKDPSIINPYITHDPCDNPACFYHPHLVHGTAKKNAEDRKIRGRANHPIGFKPIKHGITDPGDSEKIMAWIRSVTTISERQEWLYPYVDQLGYGRIEIKSRRYGVHRLILAIKLGIKYEDLDVACHKFPEGFDYSSEAPARNDVNPDHLYNGNASQNSIDALGYSKKVKVTSEKRKLILEEAGKIDFSLEGAAPEFDRKMAVRFDIAIPSVGLIRAESLNAELYKGTIKRPIIQEDKMTGAEIRRFDSATDAEQAGFSRYAINHVLSGRNKTHKGFGWRYS